MKKRSCLLLLLLLISVFSLVGCLGSGDSTEGGNTNLVAKKYEKVTEQDELGNIVSYDFNRELFYVNTLEFPVADPSIIYAEHGEGRGYFYVFGTSDQIGCHGFQCWRSKDLANWEYQGIALQPDPHKTWAANNYFAPEVIWDEEDQLYYMFYSANRINSDGQSCLSVAYSENVMGPYIIPDNEPNKDGQMLSSDKPVIDFYANQDKLPSNVELQNIAIDASPFVAPDGQKYVYWSWHHMDYSDNVWGDLTIEQRIYGMKMKDWLTPDYSTVTQLTENSRVAVDSDEVINEGDDTTNKDLNEGPHMFYDEESETYMLTFSVDHFQSENYQVRLALSDEPLSGFRKVQPEDGGVVISTNPNWDHMASAGHHCFFNVGDQTYIGYHTYMDRDTIEGGRALAIEEIKIVENEDGLPTIHANGPTYSVQPIPAEVSGYKNVAPEANVSATNVSSNSDVKYLNDGLVKIHDRDLAKETSFTGKTKITFSFEKVQELRAVMVYNSYLYDTSFYQPISIELEYVSDSKGTLSTTTIKNVPFDFDFYSYENITMRPGAASIAEFEGVPVKKVTITLDATECNISEIKLLAKENSKMTYKNNFKTSYDYTNEVKLTHFKHEGSYLGGTSLFDATYGWEFENDHGNDPYVKSSGLQESYVYFKDVVSNTFYAEGYISTYSLDAFPIEYRDAETHKLISLPHDTFPKMGMAVRHKGAAFYFFVDAADAYTKKGLGFTQSVLGTSGQWDWSATEINKTFAEVDSSFANLRYANDKFDLNNNFVKMAILRNDDKFYMFFNDKLVFAFDGLQSNITNVYVQDFVDTYGNDVPASVGFLTFSTPMIVKDYSIITNANEVAQKLAQLVKK